MQRRRPGIEPPSDQRLTWSPVSFLPAALKERSRGPWTPGAAWPSRALDDSAIIRDHGYRGLHGVPTALSEPATKHYAEVSQTSFVTTGLTGSALVAAQADPADGITLWVLAKELTDGQSVLFGNFNTSSVAYVAITFTSASIQALTDDGAGSTYSASINKSAYPAPPDDTEWMLIIARFQNNVAVKVRRYDITHPTGQDSSNGTTPTSVTGGANPLLIGKGTSTNTTWGTQQGVAMAGAFADAITDDECDDVRDAVAALLTAQNADISIG